MCQNQTARLVMLCYQIWQVKNTGKSNKIYEEIIQLVEKTVYYKLLGSVASNKNYFSAQTDRALSKQGHNSFKLQII